MELRQKFNNVDEYISTFSPEIKNLLEQLRDTIKQAAPEAEELISYNMPAFKYFGILVYYAAHKNHIGFYPGSIVINDIFKDDLADYKTSKGTIQFPYGKTLPIDLIKKLVEYRVKQNLERTRSKSKKKS